MRCNRLTGTDAFSRYLTACKGPDSQEYQLARPVFELAFREYGLPRAMCTDGGSRFASVSPGGLTRLSAWWVTLG